MTTKEIKSGCPDLAVAELDEAAIWARFNAAGKRRKDTNDESARRAVERNHEGD